MRWKYPRTLWEGQVSLTETSSAAEEVGSARLVWTETGKTRVFSGYCVEVRWQSYHCVGEDPYTLQEALSECAKQIAALGYQLIVAGLHPRFEESGLSHNSGFGYIPRRQEAIHMMDKPQTD